MPPLSRRARKIPVQVHLLFIRQSFFNDSVIFSAEIYSTEFLGISHWYDYMARCNVDFVVMMMNLYDSFFFFAQSCDADPAALAKYVVALLRKEKSKADLKDLCIDQLEVFLSKGS